MAARKRRGRTVLAARKRRGRHQSIGAFGEQVRKPEDLKGALQRALASGKPALVEVAIDQNTLAPVVFKA